ncbi:MAG: undecaprenyl-diphosphate phosphatase [Bacteroidota bacterium]
MSVFEAVILGLVQGLTEFLPVSSSGHIELGAHFLNVQNSDNLLFSIVVHGATALSTILVFRKYIVEVVKDSLSFRWNDSTQFLLQIFISMTPVAIVGLFFEDAITTLFTGQILLVAVMLSVTGILLLVTHFSAPKAYSVSYSRSFVIGLSQAAAVLPGISRSGATIATALLLGVEKTQAARFSFLMVLPPILGAMLLKGIAFFKTPALTDGISAIPLVAGFISAFVSGLLACQWMINLVKKGKLLYFAIYCFIVSGIVILLTVL